jgi:hypothetical protein
MERVEGVSIIKVHYMRVWKYHKEAPYTANIYLIKNELGQNCFLRLSPKETTRGRIEYKKEWNSGPRKLVKMWVNLKHEFCYLE